MLTCSGFDGRSAIHMFIVQVNGVNPFNVHVHVAESNSVPSQSQIHGAELLEVNKGVIRN